MRMHGSLLRVVRDLRRSLLRASLALAIGVPLAIGWTLLSGLPEGAQDAAPRPAAAIPADGWGHEAIANVQQHMRKISPIADANACGMGASSCFKCHNGARAVAPRAEKWHTDHKSVNDSCVGCHKGNARLIKAELAHAGLVKDARTQPDNCAVCHKGGNTAALLASYKK